MMVARDGIEPPTPAFSALCCTINDLTHSRWPPKYLRSRERHANRGLESWVQNQPGRSSPFLGNSGLKLNSSKCAGSGLEPEASAVTDTKRSERLRDMLSGRLKFAAQHRHI